MVVSPQCFGFRSTYLLADAIPRTCSTVFGSIELLMKHSSGFVCSALRAERAKSHKGFKKSEALAAVCRRRKEESLFLLHIERASRDLVTCL